MQWRSLFWLECRRKTATLVLILAVVLPITLTWGAEDQQILIKDSSIKQGVVLINGKTEDKPVSLECFLSHSDCAALEPGTYRMFRLPPGKGAYMDCPNVSIYKEVASARRGQKIGEYCLLEE